MAVELGKFLEELKITHPEAAETLGEVADRLLEEGKLPYSLKSTDKKSKQERDVDRELEVIDLAVKIRDGFGGKVEDNARLEDLASKRYERVFRPIPIGKEKYPEWFKLLNLLDLDTSDAHLVISSINAALRCFGSSDSGLVYQYETVGDIRKASFNELRGIKRLGKFGAVFLSVAFNREPKDKGI
ncbi:MAG TPA: hypothetical protein VF185_03685 [Patescibacteria group bacterium]